jgi:hypothetical protein
MIEIIVNDPTQGIRTLGPFSTWVIAKRMIGNANTHGMEVQLILDSDHPERRYCPDCASDTHHGCKEEELDCPDGCLSCALNEPHWCPGYLYS